MMNCLVIRRRMAKLNVMAASAHIIANAVRPSPPGGIIMTVETVEQKGVNMF